MNTGNVAPRSESPDFPLAQLSRDVSGGLLVRSALLLTLVGLALTVVYTRSSAASVHGNSGSAGQVKVTRVLEKNQLALSRDFTALPKSDAGIFMSAPAFGSLETFAANCTTPQTEFAVGDTVCVRTSGIPFGGFFPRRLSWATTDSTVVRSTSITADPQTDSLLITATTNANGRTVDNRGTWLLLVQNPFFFFPEASATFTVTDPANPSADAGVSATAGGNFVAAGSQAVFQLQIDNVGPDSSTNVELTDAVPADTSFVSFQQLSGPVFSCSSPNAGDTGTTLCSIASLPPNSTATFIATYQVNGGVSAGTTISNTATVASTADQSEPATSDPNNLNDSSTASETVAASPCVITCPSNIDTNADPGTAGAVVTYSTPGFTGDCGQAGTGEGGETTSVISCSPASGSFFAAGTTTVVCSGQTGGVCTFLVTVQNPGALSISLNGANPFALECGTDFSDPGATAINGNGDSVEVTVSGNLDIHTPGSYTLTYTATEGQNSTSTTRTVNVSDTAGPSITISGSNPLTVSCGTTFTDPGASADDACEGSRPVSSSGTVNTNTPGTYTITYTASDSHNHTSTATRSVIVEAGGSAPPIITLNGDPQVTVECGSFTDPGATAMVACGGSVPVTTSGTVDAHTPGTYTITYTACVENSPGHCDPARTSQVERTVTVEDTAAPTITVNGANPLQVQCHGTFTDPGATAHDTCAGDFAATASGTVDPNTVGTYTITYNATDPSGHVGTAVTRTVNVVDTTGPVITLNGANPIVVECHTSFSDPGATANDACTGPISVTTSGNVNVNAVGSYTITYQATDTSGNLTTATRTVTVVDTTPPTISCPANITVSLPANSSATSMVVNYTAPTGTDSCGGATTTQTGGLASGASFPAGTTTNTFRVTDGSGNFAECSFTVTVLYNFTGFFSPVGNLPILNSVNAGRAIPVKFSLSGNKGLNIFAADSPYTVSLNCDTSDPGVDVIETVTAGGSSLSYSSGSDQYNYVWKTENSWAGTCRQLVVKLNDGSTHVANFRFR